MIKLTNIIKEIKITGNLISLVFNLYSELNKYYWSDNNSNDFDLEFYNILRLFNLHQVHQDNILDRLKQFDKNKLNRFYKSLNLLKQKYNIQEIKIQGTPPARGYKELKEIFPSIKKYFQDAKIGYIEHPIGLTAYIYFTSKNKKSDRYGDKWQIQYFPFHPVPPDYKPGIYVLDIDERQNNPDYYPGYGDIFPQNKNARVFLQKLARFFREPYQEPEI